jgi:hypothetical protein
MMKRSARGFEDLLKSFLGMCLIGMIFTALFGPARLVAAAQTNDHLVPVIRYLGSAALYRKLWEQKLFVTPGDIARYVQLPGAAGREVAVSLYKQSKRGDRLPGDYWATTTQPAVPLSECIPAAGVDKPIDAQIVEIRRWDAPLPESTALAIHKLWLAMLSGIGPEPEPDVIPVDSSTEIFFATDAKGRVLEAQTPVNPKEHTLGLVKIGNLLIDYCSASASARAKLASDIEKEALALLNRVSKN